jgi:hypothetical protein
VASPLSRPVPRFQASCPLSNKGAPNCRKVARTARFLCNARFYERGRPASNTARKEGMSFGENFEPSNAWHGGADQEHIPALGRLAIATWRMSAQGLTIAAEPRHRPYRLSSHCPTRLPAGRQTKRWNSLPRDWPLFRCEKVIVRLRARITRYTVAKHVQRQKPACRQTSRDRGAEKAQLRKSAFQPVKPQNPYSSFSFKPLPYTSAKIAGQR